MTLGQLIETLEARPRDQRVPLGLGSPYSYRGYYEDLAFPLVRDTTVGAMLAHAKGALGRTYEGYKGGEYVMREHTDVWLAEWGATGEGIGPVLLEFMLGGAK